MDWEGYVKRAENENVLKILSGNPDGRDHFVHLGIH
jgi:hypothetical protein